MIVLDTHAIRNLNWGDAQLFGFVWENEGRDLKLFINHASKPISALTCYWASDLQVDLNWDRPPVQAGMASPRRGGPLLSWACQIEATGDGRWKVFFDFAQDGCLSLECEKIAAVGSPDYNLPMDCIPHQK
ncbi:MAG TPA: hypothetical protein VJL29_12285 [Thermoguttaceae bacterium]|nr:hypothetical protein [Thermoguttaceae bacterium]